MIERYRLLEMSRLFEDKARFSAYLEVELAVSSILADKGIIPEEAYKAMKTHATLDLQRIHAIEKETAHDVIAFTRAVGETLKEEKQWFHYGLTSTDVVDTAMSLIYKQANARIYDKILKFMSILKKHATQYAMTPMIGRTHGMHAEVTSFGLKFAVYYDEFSRHLKRFNHACHHIEVGKFSGAVGTHTLISPENQDLICTKLGLNSAKISTQTLQRDRHAEYISVLTLIASSIEKIAIEIRHLQRSEVAEVSEYFSETQKGSSAMPHKKNPIASENMSGCARLMRGYMHSVYENIALWHERDISHSSVERVVFPDALCLLDYMLNRYTKVLDTIIVYPDRMLDNIALSYGVIHSQAVLNALIEQGVSREEAYDSIQPLAVKAIKDKIPFKDILENDDNITKKLTKDRLNECFDLSQYLVNVPKIYRRVFEEDLE